MTGSFACPECGEEVALKGATPGREVQCSRCATWVEVPYLPRDGVWTRPKFRKARPAWVVPLAWACVGLLALVVAIVGGSKYVESKSRTSREATLDEILRTVDQAEKGGRADRALSEIEAALAFVRQGDPIESTRLAELQHRRDLLSFREAEIRIAASSRLEPIAAVGDLLTLQARAGTDRALDSLTSTILESLDAARRRLITTSFVNTQRARDENRPFDALRLGEQALAVAEKLDASAQRSAFTEAELILTPIVAKIGVILVQSPGRFTLGSTQTYETALGPILADKLRKQGYAPRPTRGPARVLWDGHAPYRVEFQIVETQGSLYLESKSRVSDITASISLARGQDILWETRLIGRTLVPLPDLAAYVGSRLAVSDRRNPEAERLLYENARGSLIEQAAARLSGLPPL